MIKVTNKEALKLIAPSVEKWASIYDILSHLQSIHYIDCSKLTGGDWEVLLHKHPEFEQLCTEHNGWSKMDGSDWYWILFIHPQFADKGKEHNAWKKIDGTDWCDLLKEHPQLVQFEKYRK